MKTVSVRQLSHEGASKVVAAAAAEPVLVTKNNEPAVWMVGASELARVASQVKGGDDVYRHTLALVAVDLFDRGTLSLGRSARFAGVDLAAFIELCGRLHVSILRAPEEGFEAELAAFEDGLHASEKTQPVPL
ncbi:MAG: UPF0175 family protein [Chloroflexota bacterium]|nr:MAG: hypothetical protein DLM70_12480 [Chloroflexota bacterium]